MKKIAKMSLVAAVSVAGTQLTKYKRECIEHDVMYSKPIMIHKPNPRFKSFGNKYIKRKHR